MKFLHLRALLAAAATAAAPCAALAMKVTPTQQVISMLTEMKTKGTKMIQEEKEIYAAYAQWAHDTTEDLALSIKSANSKSQETIAFIEKTQSDLQTLGQEISELQGEIGRLESEKKEATEDRQAEHAEYLKVSADYAESVDALQRAIQELSAQHYDRPQAEVLLQRLSLSMKGMPRVLAALQEQKSGQKARRGDLDIDSAPEVAAYEFQSGGIVEVLDNLLDKFKQELADVEEAEANQAHAFAMTQLDLSNTVKRDSSDRDEKAIAKGKRMAEVGGAKGELSTLQAEKAADEKLNMDTETTFNLKTSLFKENQQVRADELEAIGKAIEIISSPEVATSYAKHLALSQAQGAVALLQMGRRSRRVDTRQRVSELLRRHADKLKSSTLASVADAVAANPFAKVIGMIEGLLAKLKAEAVSEASHKAWCDEQLKDNKLKRNKKTAQVNKLQAEVDDFSAKIADQGATIVTLTKEQAQLRKDMVEATAQRQEEHKRNTAVVADSAAGADAVKRALVILREFYSNQAAFLQQEPEMKSYNGMQGGTKGVLGMLEVIAADFSRLRADTETAEHAAAGEYETYTKESEASIKQKHEAEVQLRLDKDQAEFEKSRTVKDLAGTEEELQEANKYYGELRPSCIQVHVSYEERVAGRKEELEALREAYRILGQQSAE